MDTRNIVPLKLTGDIDFMASKSSVLFRLSTLEKKLSEGEPKKKDFWDKFGILTSFVSSVILAIVATAFTISFQRAEQSRLDREEIAERDRNARLDALSEEQLYLRNIETVAKFLPFLTGEDADEQSKKLALIAIQEFASTRLAAEYATAVGGTGAEEALVFIAERPDATCSDVGIATEALEIIRQKSVDGNNTIVISGESLAKLFSINQFDHGDDSLVFFAVRGAMPISVSQSNFSAEYEVQIPARDLSKMRDLIGQWRPSDGQIALFPGSTLPSARFLSRPGNPNGTAYMLPGLYSYKLDVHRGGANPHVAFRQETSNPTARTKDTILGNSDDFIDYGDFGLNIHAAFHRSELETETGEFTSAGTVVISGPPEERADGDLSLYQRFLASAVEAGQESFLLAIFSINDLIVAQEAAPDFFQVRYGSSGEQARALLIQLQEHSELFRLERSEKFDFETLSALNSLPADARASVVGDCGLITTVDDTTLQALSSISQKN